MKKNNIDKALARLTWRFRPIAVVRCAQVCALPLDEGLDEHRAMALTIGLSIDDRDAALVDGSRPASKKNVVRSAYPMKTYKNKIMKAYLTCGCDRSVSRTSDKEADLPD